MSDDLDEPDDLDPERTAALLASVQLTADQACGACGADLCGHDAVIGIVLGYKDRPHCHRCIADELHETPSALCERTLQWVRRRACFLRAWNWASRSEHKSDSLRPRCLWRGEATSARGDMIPADPPATATAPEIETPDAAWDAGDLGCGELVLELRLLLRSMPAGSTLELRAVDPGAPQDIPAWCGLTGHTLVRASHPTYWIRRKYN